MTTINNLTKHDSQEFKVGDLVVFVNSKSDDEDLYAVEAVLDDGAFLGISHYRQAFSANKIRHATRSESKAGHRIDDNTDHVTDIRNHVSPSTKVVDLGCNHNFEDVTIYGDSHKTYQCTICEFRDEEAERHG